MCQCAYADRARSRTLRFRPGRSGVGLLVVVLLFQVTGHAQEVANDPIVGISTSWKIRLIEPNDNASLPQIIAVLTPNGTLLDNYALLELNHTSLPSYSAGGIQLQIWNYDQELTWSDPYSPGNRCRCAGEEISFKLNAEIVKDANSPSGKSILFSVHDFRSVTWGEYASLRSFCVPTRLQSFDGFTPAECVKESGVNAGGAEVEYMMIDSIEYRFASGDKSGDSTDHYVHTRLVTAETKLDGQSLGTDVSY